MAPTDVKEPATTTPARRSRFVDPTNKPVRIALSAGDWIEVKERLTYGEQQRLASAALFRSGDGNVGVDWARGELAMIEMWVVAWSFRDAEDRPVSLTAEAIQQLNPLDAVEIVEAVRNHRDEQEKKERASRQ